ncbi:hypothetical protein RIR_jg24075.t1 [Rhizophagus irregularis DAOM 181602=DAOM 197198]|nr:hypothetical protein RIR_jg24075.t1 [Rhizophagus irregularis DAOM 181602=DAOM 197198]
MVFMDKVPYEVLDHAITNAIQARDEVITRNKENQHQHLVLHFRSKKNDLHRKSIRKNQAKEIHVAAINPRIRTFLTWYSPTVGYENIGDNDINHVFCLCLALDAFISCTNRALAKKA